MNDKVTLGQPRPKRRRAAALQGVFVVMGMRRWAAIGEDDAPAIKKLAAGHDSNEHSRVALLGDADGRDSLGFVLSPRLSPAVHELIGSGLRFNATAKSYRKAVLWDVNIMRAKPPFEMRPETLPGSTDYSWKIFAGSTPILISQSVRLY